MWAFLMTGPGLIRIGSQSLEAARYLCIRTLILRSSLTHCTRVHARNIAIETLHGEIMRDTTTLLGPPLLSTEEVAIKLRISMKTLRGLVNARQLRAVRFNARLWRFDPDIVRLFIERRMK